MITLADLAEVEGSYPDVDLIASPRKLWYNPVLDPRLIAEKMTPKMAQAVEGDYYPLSGPLNEPDNEHPHNLVSSLCEDGMHRLAIDIDRPVRADQYGPSLVLVWAHVQHVSLVSSWSVPRGVIVGSSTPGHHHVYGPEWSYTWEDYQGLLWALVGVGLVDRPYVEASIVRGQTLLRPPHIRKSGSETGSEATQG